uniref:AlNc14C334G10713 protein n=1 Tax=Albugo laibachii Nc14 TaxID=890382 RepID=F0WWV2_9STRA|nr:AlNc14C334G10713 [Albugo laibachii Nc14]|eukprot:CCA25937.1 AlNc14C334G10713 [Albugo laibachii Nc14]
MTTFPKLIETLINLNGIGVRAINHLLTDQKFWPFMDDVAVRCKSLKSERASRGDTCKYSQIRVRPDPFVAAMLMFYPEFAKKKNMVEYTLEETNPSDQISDRSSLKAKIIGERKITDDYDDEQTTQSYTGKYSEFFQDPYKHLLLKKIKRKLFETTILSLLHQYLSE